jgi:lipopolysaccharide assembly outer membrane protein LptD (OstA)
MLLQQNKILILLLFIYNISLAENKEIKKIVSDSTEFDRKNNVVNFHGNVKVYFVNGWITCDKAVYDEKNGKLNCESNVFLVYSSTTGNIEVKSFSLEYNTNQKLLKFYNNISAMYKIYDEEQKQTIFDKILLTSSKFVVDMDKKNMIAEDDVIIDLKGNKVYCSIVQYDYNDNILKINNEVDVKKQLRFEFLQEEWKIKYCQADTAVINVNDNKLMLKGKVELLF